MTSFLRFHTFGRLPALVLCLALLTPLAALAEAFLVKDGTAQAEIILPEEAPRSTRLAAAELQHYVQKITGAQLPVRADSTTADAIRIHIGESEATRALGVTAEGLEHGAFRIVSGEDWLVFIGNDTNFVPREPWAKSNSQRQEWLQTAWEEASGLPYGVPNGGLYKNRDRMPEDLARENPEYLWGFDERGSFNAVCEFLRSLGVRWFAPGELGEVLPQMSSIPLPEIDETVEPDFEIRQFNARFGTLNDEMMKWCMRLGIRNSSGLQIAHGMHTMTHPPEIKEEHPEWFALYGGKRDTLPGEKLHHLCYSNEELFQETVKWARAQFDVYDFESVSIMPPDAYISICQCELCEGKQIDEMGPRGKLSNHVWDFANRVAKEVAKSHPDKLVLCCAYGANTNPPTNIDKLEPNVQVVIVGGRRPRNSLPEQREAIQELRAGWLEKTDRPIMIFENYPFTGRGTYLPAFVARTIGDSINATKGVSRGEDIWLSFPRFHDDPNMGFDHFQIYFTARMWWGGQDADIEALLTEYCELFYGPAGPDMKRFFDYCERHYQAMEDSKEKVDTALSMFASAKDSVSPDSAYAQRLALIDQFLEALRSKSDLLAQKRGPVPKLRTVWEPKEPIVVDGLLDDQYWQDVPASSTGRLSELQLGGRPVFGTQIMAAWDRSGQNLYFAIRCEERPGEPLNITAEKDEDEAIWYGDAVEILLDTDSHSYYQIAVNPAGALVDLDRGASREARLRWESQAEVATHVADDHWTIEIRIPVTDDENDPLNQVVGRKPSQSLPWHFNICRQRIRDNGAEYSAFSPTGTAGFHEPMKFAHFHDGRSHAFEADESVTDFLIEWRKAEQLQRGREHEAARHAFLALADSEKATDLQGSQALARAAAAAIQSDTFEEATSLAEQITLEPIAITTKMEILLAQRNRDLLLSQYGDVEIASWPFTQIGAGAFTRAKASYGEKLGEQAETDLQLALEFTSDPRSRISILRMMGHNREHNLQNDDLALETYLEISNSTTNTGSAEYYYGIQGAAGILMKRAQFDEALAILDRVNISRLSGSWETSMKQLREDILEARK